MLEFVDKNVIFDAKEIFSIVKQNHDINTSFIIEEIGVNMDATQWQQKINRQLKHMAQTIRHRRYNMFYTVPNLSSSAKQNRILMPIIFETAWIDRNVNKCFIQPKFFPVNPRTGELKSPNGTCLLVDGVPLSCWGIPLLPKEVVEKYEARKLEFTEKLYASMNEEEKEEEAKKEKKEDNSPTHFCIRCTGVFKSKSINPVLCPLCKSPGKMVPVKKERMAGKLKEFESPISPQDQKALLSPINPNDQEKLTIVN
jgi:rubrerythrin